MRCSSDTFFQNLVRQGLYYNYDYYRKLGGGAFKNEDHIVKLHISTCFEHQNPATANCQLLIVYLTAHCLDIIRQQLMCTVDTAVFGQVWVDQSAPFSYVDFNAKDHVCKNFEDIRSWVAEHQLPMDVPKDFLAVPADDDLVYPEIP